MRRILAGAFLTAIEMIFVKNILSTICVILITDVFTSNQPCISEINPTLLWFIIFLYLSHGYNLYHRLLDLADYILLSIMYILIKDVTL